MKPIIFNTEMVRAILDNRKTQTRRPVKQGVPLGNWDETIKHAPYQVGDVLYVRETAIYWVGGGAGIDVVYSDESEYENLIADNKILDGLPESAGIHGRWKKVPSIHMPKWAARIFLKVTAVRLERVQDIDRRGAMSEGIESFWMYGGVSVNGVPGLVYPKPNQTWTHREAFSKLWDYIYGNWAENPWVWVIEFERINKP